MDYSKENLEKLFLDYWVNFLTVDRFSEYYNLNIDQAYSIINRGRVIFYSNSDQYRDHFADNFYNKSTRLRQGAHNKIINNLL